MTYEFQFDPDTNFVFIRCCGTATAAGFEKLDRELIEHPLMKPDIDALIDERELDLSGFSADDLRTNAEQVKGHSEQWGCGRWAYVVQADFGYGMGRMWELNTEDGIDAKLRMFRSMTEAREWLKR
jgi:hypothetical protein